MSDYFPKTDPGLAEAIKESAWDSFFEALEKTTPEVMAKLKERPFEVFRELVEDYKKVSRYEFGRYVHESGGRPTVNLRPLRDLATLISSPENEGPKSDWPPSAAFWEPAMQRAILKLATVMKGWAANFIDENGNPHVHLVTVALETMSNWLINPGTIASDHWLGQARCIAGHTLQPQQFNFQFSGWSPTRETEAEFKARVKVQAQELIQWSKTHLANVKSHLVKYDTKRNPEHYRWAALRLAREMTYPAIAEHWANRTEQNLGLDEGTVRKGVHAVLKDLDLRDVRARRK